MVRVGLTGNIGAGKSTVGRMFVDLGARVLDADAIVHRLFEPGQAVNRSVVEAFGAQAAAPDGGIDRKVLGALVFGDEAARKKLNSIVHPAVIETQRVWLDELAVREPDAVAIVEAALMIEAGTYKNYQKLIVVVCSFDEQRRRLRGRSGLSDEEILARIQSQMPAEEKIRYADFVIDNSGTLENTRQRVKDVFDSLGKFEPR